MLNMTPHAITLRTAHGDIVFPPSGVIARVETVESLIGSMDVFSPGTPVCDAQGNSNGVRVPVISRTFGEVEGLPKEGVPCIVSALVLSAVPGRAGVYAPDTGVTAVRNEKGFVVAVTRLVAA